MTPPIDVQDEEAVLNEGNQTISDTTMPHEEAKLNIDR